MEQPEYNMFNREKMEKEFLHLFNYHGIGTTIWSPLASGILSGKYSVKNPPKNTRLEMNGLEWLKTKILQKEKLAKAEKLLALSKKLNVSMPNMCIAWVLKNKHVSTAILGASKTEQLKETLSAINAQSIFTKEVINEIEKILDNKPLLPEW